MVQNMQAVCLNDEQLVCPTAASMVYQFCIIYVSLAVGSQKALYASMLPLAIYTVNWNFLQEYGKKLNMRKETSAGTITAK
jgi:hypothetical protein